MNETTRRPRSLPGLGGRRVARLFRRRRPDPSPETARIAAVVTAENRATPALATAGELMLRLLEDAVPPVEPLRPSILVVPGGTVARDRLAAALALAAAEGQPIVLPDGPTFEPREQEPLLWEGDQA